MRLPWRGHQLPVGAALWVACDHPTLLRGHARKDGPFGPPAAGRLWDVSDQHHPIGERLFTDGSVRPVFELPDGRQYVECDDGERVYGTWLPPADEPVPVNAEPRLT
jgi:hypothetical protein